MDVSRAGAHTPNGMCYGVAAQHSRTWGGCALCPSLTSWTRVLWQFLRSGPCSSTLGAPGCNKSIVLRAGSTPVPSVLPHHVLTGGRLTSQYACS